MWTTIKRVVRSGFTDFWRNSFVSIASIFVMTVTLFVIGSIFFIQATLDTTLMQLRDKVDVNVYFALSAREDQILNLKKDLESLPHVKNVEYKSREQVYNDFKERHQDDQLTLQALDELGENPLGAMLNIRANDTEQYEAIAQFLETHDSGTGGSSSIVDKVNFYQNKIAIDKLTSIIKGSEQLGFVITIILVVMSVMITFNTIRLAIYSSRDEIALMRLVGASYTYIRGPFVVEGIMAGAFSAIIALALFYPLTFWLGPSTEEFFGGLNLFEYFISHFEEFFLVIMGSGIALGAVSSYLAVKKYLRV